MAKTINILRSDINLQNFDTLFKTPVNNRENFKLTEEEFTYNQVVAQVLGCQFDEFEYYSMLYEISLNDVCIISNRLDRTIDNNIFQFLQKLLKINDDENGLTVNKFIAYLDGERLIPHIPPLYTKSFFIEKLKLILNHYKSLNHNFLDSKFKRFFVDLIKFQKNYVEKIIKDDYYIPKIIWCNEYSNSSYFLIYYAILLGFDLLYLNSEGKEIEIDIKKLKFESTAIFKEFPTKKPIQNKTVALNASKQLEQIIYTENSLIYKPWQFRSYISKSITLKTTYDEIFILQKEMAFIRPNFMIEDQTVFIPSIFSKVKGISPNSKDYWDKFNQLKDNSLNIIYSQFPITKEQTSNQHFYFQKVVSKDELLDFEKLSISPIWKYKELPTGLQNSIVCAFNRIIISSKLTPLLNEGNYQLKLYMFNQLLNIPKNILRLLIQFDYTQVVPKIIIFNSGKSGQISRNDAFLLLLLNELGLDIILYNPTAQNDIELYIDENYLDVHWLEKISFDEEIKDPNLIDKIFKFFN